MEMVKSEMIDTMYLQRWNLVNAKNSYNIFFTWTSFSHEFPKHFQRLFYTTVNPADSKHKVYRHNYDDWFVGNRQISWDPNAAELQDDTNVDIHLFSLKVFLAIDSCYLQILRLSFVLA